MIKVKANFENQKVFVGLDVHKRSWNAAIFLGDYFVRNIHQPPSPQALQHFLTRNYPGAGCSNSSPRSQRIKLRLQLGLSKRAGTMIPM